MAAARDAIHVEQDITPGELVDDRSIVVAVTSRRKLGKQLTIARCVVDDVRGELSGGLAQNEIIDVVAGGASAKAFAAGPAQRPRHRLGAVVIETKPSRSGRRVARVLRYDGAAASHAPVVLVGKGITFDTGGISLKPGAGMDEMKFDMGGAASVLGTFQSLALLKPKLNVVGLIPTCENMPSGTATKPGDVVKSMSGQTIEVLNTDAEGRLVLSDGLWKAGTDYDPEYIVDFATLTGACVVALGHEATGLWSNDDDFRTRIHEAGNDVGELAWPMPLLPAFEKEMTDSKIADTRNLGAGRWGGANTAAAFLKQFVPNRGEGDDAEQITWAHMDIAGTYWGAKTNKMVGHGATGIHVRTMVRLITGE